MFSGKFIKKNGKLTYATPKDKLAYEIFVDMISEGEVIDMFLEVSSPDHSKAQLAKVHACIRELAKESGYTFDVSISNSFKLKQLIKVLDKLVTEFEPEK